MVRQQVPDIEFGRFVLGQIKELFTNKKIKINTEYQRGDIWRETQRNELIKSIESSYSIGVLVLFVNEKGQYEVLDGQQRLLTILKYLNDELLNLEKSNIKKYSELDSANKILTDAYCIYFLKLKSFSEETKEEDIVQTFLRLQEGSPLNKAEKINAHRGKFKDVFRELRNNHSFFKFLEPDKRFRLRLLAAEFLMLEIETNFDNGVFPKLTLDNFKIILKRYENEISDKKIKFLKGNLDFLERSLNNFLTAMPLRDIFSFYLLVSYLRKNKSKNENLVNELRVFAEDFLEKLNSFSIYDSQPPKELSQTEFDNYRKYKEEARKATSSDSIRYRFEFILKEFQKMTPIIQKDEKRLHDIEQKRILFFRQKGNCPECGKKLDLKNSSSHHKIAHAQGGETDSLKNAVLLHQKCHKRLEKKLLRS